jgi:hypothetical protein
LRRAQLLYEDGNDVAVGRSDGTVWVLQAKTTCLWCWRQVEEPVLLKFGFVSSVLISSDAEVSQFWTEGQLR